MATGYTYPILDGTDPSAAAFLRRYAYAFGALIDFRDSDRDKTKLPDLPEELPLTAREYLQFDHAREELQREQAKTPQELHFEFAEFEEQRAKRQENLALDRGDVTARYQAVFDALMSQATDGDSDGQRFLTEAIKAIKESMEWDCVDVTPYLPNPSGFDEWNKARLATATRNVEYTGERLLEAQSRARRNYRWLQEVKELVAKVEEVERGH